MSKKPRYFMVGGNEPDEEPQEVKETHTILPNVSDAEIDDLYKSMGEIDPKQSNFPGSKREYVDAVYKRINNFLIIQGMISPYNFGYVGKVGGVRSDEGSDSDSKASEIESEEEGEEKEDAGAVAPPIVDLSKPPTSDYVETFLGNWKTILDKMSSGARLTGKRETRPIEETKGDYLKQLEMMATQLGVKRKPMSISSLDDKIKIYEEEIEKKKADLISAEKTEKSSKKDMAEVYEKELEKKNELGEPEYTPEIKTEVKKILESSANIVRRVRNQHAYTLDYPTGSYIPHLQFAYNPTMDKGKPVENSIKTTNTILKEELSRFETADDRKETIANRLKIFKQYTQGIPIPVPKEEIPTAKASLLNITLYPYVTDFSLFNGPGALQRRFVFGAPRDVSKDTIFVNEYGKMAEYAVRTNDEFLNDYGVADEKYNLNEVAFNPYGLIDADIFDIQSFRNGLVCGEIKNYKVSNAGVKFQLAKLAFAVYAKSVIDSIPDGSDEGTITLGEENIKIKKTARFPYAMCLYNNQVTEYENVPSDYAMPLIFVYDLFELIDKLKTPKTTDGTTYFNFIASMLDQPKKVKSKNIKKIDYYYKRADGSKRIVSTSLGISSELEKIKGITDLFTISGDEISFTMEKLFTNRIKPKKIYIRNNKMSTDAKTAIKNFKTSYNKTTWDALKEKVYTRLDAIPTELYGADSAPKSMKKIGRKNVALGIFRPSEKFYANPKKGFVAYEPPAAKTTATTGTPVVAQEKSEFSDWVNKKSFDAAMTDEQWMNDYNASSTWAKTITNNPIVNMGYTGGITKDDLKILNTTAVKKFIEDKNTTSEDIGKKLLLWSVSLLRKNIPELSEKEAKAYRNRYFREYTKAFSKISDIDRTEEVSPIEKYRKYIARVKTERAKGNKTILQPLAQAEEDEDEDEDERVPAAAAAVVKTPEEIREEKIAQFREDMVLRNRIRKKLKNEHMEVNVKNKHMEVNEGLIDLIIRGIVASFPELNRSTDVTQSQIDVLVQQLKYLRSLRQK